jgi:fibronectin type 3 domain-containing protein
MDASSNHEGYNVYRGGAGNWTKLNSDLIKPVLKVSEIRLRVRFKAETYLALFGVESDALEIPKSTFTQRLSDPAGAPLIGAICMVNPEFGELLGVRFTDVSPHGSTQYKITTVRGASESDWATSAQINAATDSDVPMAEGLTITCGDARVDLEWKKDMTLMKRGAIVSYHVYRSGNLLGPYERIDYTGILPVTVSSGSHEGDPNYQAYSDLYVNNGTAYYYYVMAVNAFGLESLPTTTVHCTPNAGSNLTAATGLKAELVGSLVQLSWTSTLEGLSTFHIYRSADGRRTFKRVHTISHPGSSGKWFDASAAEGSTYHYFVQSVADNDNRVSSDTIAFTYSDHTPPEAPAGVKAAIENGQIVIRWTRNMEKDLAGYEVERASDKQHRQLFRMTASTITTNYYTDQAPPQSPARYGYVVYAFDKSNNKSAPSEMVFARMPDKTPPQVPTITGSRVDSQVVKITWTQNIEDDFAKYRLWRYEKDPLKKILLRELREATAFDKPPKDGAYQYVVAAVDSTGNESKPSLPVRVVVTTDVSVPTPTSLTVGRQDNDLLVTWQCTATKTLAGFVITRKDMKTGNVVMVAQLEDPTARSYEDVHGDVNASYEYKLQAFDTRWRMGEGVTVRWDGK